MRKLLIIIFLILIGCKDQLSTKLDKETTEYSNFDFYLIQPDVSIEYIRENLGSPYKINQNLNSTDFIWIDKNIELDIVSQNSITVSEITFRIDEKFKNYFKIPNPNRKTKINLPEIGKLTFEDLENYKSPFGKRLIWEYYRGYYYPKYTIDWTISGAGTELEYEFSSMEGIKLPENTDHKAFQAMLKIEDLPNPKVNYLSIK